MLPRRVFLHPIHDYICSNNTNKTWVLCCIGCIRGVLLVLENEENYSHRLTQFYYKLNPAPGVRDAWITTQNNKPDNDSIPTTYFCKGWSCCEEKRKIKYLYTVNKKITVRVASVRSHYTIRNLPCAQPHVDIPACERVVIIFNFCELSVVRPSVRHFLFFVLRCSDCN